MTGSRNGRLWASGIATLLVALLVGVAVMLQAQGLEESRLYEQVQRSHHRRTLLQTVLSDHQDMETGQRGYLLTGQRSFLRPYEEALRRTERGLDALAAMPASAEAHANMQLLKRLSEQKAVFAAQTLARFQEGDPAGALAMVRSGRGKQLMDGIRAQISRETRAEVSRLAAVSAQSKQAQVAMRRNSFLLLAALAAILCVCGLVVLRALSSRRRAFERLDDLSRRRQAILDSAMDGIFILNPSGSIESMNRAAARMFGYTPDELLRRDIGMLFETQPPPGQVAAYLRSMRLVSGEPGMIHEVQSRHNNGEIFACDVAVSAVALSDGVHYVAVARDITERKRAERVKGEFVATVSHELRTPLTSISGSLGLLVGGAGGALPDKAQRLIHIARDNADRLIRLINDILDIEKVDSGRMTFSNRYLDLAPLLQQAVDLHQGYAEKYQVTLHLESIPAGTFVWADPDRLMQVFANLISNAIKFSFRGETVRIAVETGRGQHRISIIDRGRGIDEAFRKRIFQRFSQSDSSDAREKGGTGLGLSIVKDIVTRLGGSIDFVSEPGEGTCFRVDLAAATPEEAEGLVDRLLICERDAELAKQMAQALTATGLACDIVHSSAQAMMAAQERQYRVILVDTNLPSGGGIALVRGLRQIDAVQAVPIFMISVDSRQDGIEAEALHIVDWLQKPLPLDRLITAVRAALDGRQRSGRPRILHVDDDPDVLRLVATALEGQAEVESVGGVKEARRLLSTRTYDLTILDLGLADGSGLDLLPDLRRVDNLPVPVIIFSAQDADPEVAASVQAYLTKSRTPIDRLVATVHHLWQQDAARTAP
ncbi:ATP-binding protein [Sphingomonas mucosissima]|uniref:histidine kinase n=1 Tax=Sphingomonas mucosissima TaxID=370959 RepID=A0A245ZJM7_9SPHN|nr:ATP-binding protein [Sphingomonas mucosissima]OWK29937.1 sensor protein EvgS precursor [Sphingomonas mucosissima]